MDARTAFKTGIGQLRDAGVSSFTLAAELLLLHVAAKDRTWLYAHPEDELSPEQEQRYFALVARRIAGEPTQHLTGKQEFWGLEFEVTPAVLIPRPETEHVIEVALDRLALREIRAGRKQTLSGEGLRIADIGTGSGCIAVALAKDLPGAKFIATDISPAALEVACRNAARLGFANQIEFLESNLFDRIRRTPSARAAANIAEIDQSRVPSHQSPSFHLIVSNPPYIGRHEAPTLAREVRDHEPATALFGGEEGYELYADLITQSAEHLEPGGILVLELGHNSLPAVRPLFDTPHWTHVGVTNDLASIPRVIAAERT
jgi:release factor glutamine methyltransferase